MAPRSPGWVRWLRRARAQTRLWFGGLWSGSALLLGLLVVVADGLLALHASWSVLLSGVELLLLVAWLRTMSGHTRKAPRGREKLMGAVLMLAVCGAFAQKSLHLHQGLSGGGEAAATFYRTFAGVGAVLAVLGVVGRGDRLARFLDAVARQPARVAGLSFTLTILAGGVLLAHPLSLRGEQGAAFLDALFTATSAVCLTGFCRYDVPTTYTFFGQAVILLLCQIGGLGYVVLASAVALVAGRRLKVHESLAVAQTVDTSSVGDLRKSIRNIVLVTLSVELVGAALLYLATLGMPEVAWGHESPHLAAGAGNRVWWALFLSVSAFCNCGFVLSHGNLMAFAGSWPISLVVAALIFVGGIGFPVLEELARAVRARRAKIRPARLSLHTRVVLTASVVLVVAPAVMVFVLERRGALAHLAVWEQGLAALFQSVSMRTGGFNSVDIGAFGPAAMLLTSVVMFVGASPVSTAGGVRTTSVAAVYALVRSELRGESARLFDRELPSAVTRRATATIALGAAIWFSAASALLLQQGIEPMRAIFEIASAFATCGLSVGVTAQVNDLGKVVMIVTMVVGRVGPLTVVASLLTPKPPSRVQLIEERVLLG